MDGRPARAAVGYLACLVIDVALVWWTLAIWRWASKPETAWLRRGMPWAFDSCSGATFLGIAMPLTIASAVLVLTFSLPRDPLALKVGTAIATVLTLLVVIAPGIESVLSSCVS
jgi:hypothetical protein